MSDDDKGKEIATRKGDDQEGEPKREGKLRWVLGWVVLPGTVIGGIFGGGVVVGAHFHDSWFTSAIVWLAEIL